MKVNCFDEIIKESTIICEQEDIDIPNIESVYEASSNQEPKQSTKKRKINDNDDLNCDIKNHKDKIIKIIDIYIQYDNVIVNPLGNLKKVHNNKFYTVSNLFLKKIK